MPANGTVASESLVQPGVATPLDSNPFAAIYIAKDHVQQPEAAGSDIRDASASGVSGADQIAINTAIKLTEKTWFVQLKPSEFPSYEGSLAVAIAETNFTALSQAGIGWPVSDESNSWFKDLLKVLGLYTGHSFTVCDVFGNGDSVCVVPDPFDNDVYTQTGPAKDANGNQLSDIGSRVAGGGGSGMGVTQNPPNIEYFLPPSGGGSGITCGYVDGHLSTCIKQE